MRVRAGPPPGPRSGAGPPPQPLPYQVGARERGLHLMQNSVQKDPLLLESHPHLQQRVCGSSQGTLGGGDLGSSFCKGVQTTPALLGCPAPQNSGLSSTQGTYSKERKPAPSMKAGPLQPQTWPEGRQTPRRPGPAPPPPPPPGPTHPKATPEGSTHPGHARWSPTPRPFGLSLPTSEWPGS